MSKYETVIGLEIHAEMLTESKMFSGCRVVDSVEAAPNSAVDGFSLGMPGMLPVINRAAVEMAMKVGLALNCQINPYNAFERKNYFYPDLPKGYQITQYAHPIATNGYLDVELESGATRRIRIRRAHIEEDTGKLTHMAGATSLVDFNRAGVPLLEIVSEPDMRTAEEALAYASQIRQVLRYLDVNTGDMEKGIIRFEANISLRPKGSDALNTRVEVKNLNSFRALAGAIEYCAAEQERILEAGGAVEQATLGWDENHRRTLSQRSKEDAHDYRYFPEPDLPPLWIDPTWIDAVRAGLVELPDAKRARFETAYGLPTYDAHVLTEERQVAEWFEAAVRAGGDPKSTANWLINNLFALMNEHRQTIEEIRVTPQALANLLGLIDRGVVNQNSAKVVLAEMFSGGQPAEAIVEAQGLAQITDEGPILAAIETIVRENPEMVASYLGGKEKLRGWFVGQAMRALRGQGNPQLVNDILDRVLDAQR